VAIQNVNNSRFSFRQRRDRKMKIYRQGDVLFIQMEIRNIERMKEDLSKLERTTVVARGEATGHTHELSDPDSAILVEVGGWFRIERYDSRRHDFRIVLHTDTGATIKHPEHGHLNLPKGTYMIRNQREYMSYTDND